MTDIASAALRLAGALAAPKARLLVVPDDGTLVVRLEPCAAWRIRDRVPAVFEGHPVRLEERDLSVQGTPVWVQARDWARAAHAGQSRKMDPEPYANHLERVARSIVARGGDAETAAAGWLHDIVEDQQVPVAEVRARMGDRVARLVAGATEPGSETKPKASWRARKHAFVARLESADPDLQLLVACDKIDNLSSLRTALDRGVDAWPHLKEAPAVNVGFYLAVARTMDGPVGDELAALAGDIARRHVAVTPAEALAAFEETAPRV
jgi:hypothetical protein